MRILNSLVIAGSVMVMSHLASADVITLEGGDQIHGDVIGNDDSSLWVKVGSQVIQVKRSQISDHQVSNPDEVDTVIRRYLYHTDEDPTELTIEQQANRVKPSVIKVQTPAGLGSGVIINEDGYAITNAHVIQGETDLRTTIWLPTEGRKSRRTTSRTSRSSASTIISISRS